LTHNIVDDLAKLAVPIADLAHDPRPHRIHPPDEIEDLKASLTRFGQDQPLVVQREGMIVRVGNGRLKAARALGWTHVAAVVLDRAHAEMVARGIIDNRVADKARNDMDVLAELIGELQQQDASLPVGFTAEEIEVLVDRAAGAPPADEAPVDADPEGEAAAGDAWRCGEHVVVCGSSSDLATVNRAFELAGGPADQIVTDPPYGVDYEGAAGKIQNDSKVEGGYAAFFAGFLSIAPMATPNTAYIFMSGQELHSLRAALETAVFTWGDYLIWLKNRPVLGRKDYNAAHEFVVYAWKGKHRFYGKKGQANTVLSFDRPTSSPDHPTMKPTDLLGRLIRDGSKPHALVYDAFLGSGSTMLAAEMTGRRCVGIELEPRFCLTAVRRWERHTDQLAEKL
jgi:DNA modification methylase